ncbi:FG-nucleoporin NUP159 NDAI_0B03720 [Naumovozyma dairenensis CBS 421]|uniref:Nucleoporin Nup159/Nup146 N-terminal domain-containing protein n=1 Tax=Naumovozyma dairenensis (strain ATCC 10597 / BCRC 20456 / CBS 421 / NBRC 0211 / NRRL Y-12639) TaxID=1071378 RepID=G0W6J5_NAUDC|nr:hypothetical protein NDAI_0B03720 [Naumovozyma dairenensis CBS 421]CCD23406.1 hypothetical protein NDAI_0B03720 [Naumovozyma dairenensis CBS 421]
MSTLKDEEVITTISEDFGFKGLGIKAVLPSYNEKLPFASLHNFDISNEQSLFAASCGGKTIVGNLQDLRDLVTTQSKKNAEDGNDDDDNDAHLEDKTEAKTKLLSNIWESVEILNVIFVKIFENKNVLIITRDGDIMNLNLSSNSKDIEAVFSTSENDTFVDVQATSNNSILFLNDKGQLYHFNLTSREATILLEETVGTFNIVGTTLSAILKNGQIKLYKCQGTTLTEKAGFTIPTEVKESFNEEPYIPNGIQELSDNELLVVLGIEVSEATEDVMYDQKMYIVKHSGNNAEFQESFDITPAFGSVLRYPTFYDIQLPNLIESTQTINILGSASASDLTIWDSKEVIQPSQDSERAVLPINKETNNDTNPIGMAMDISSTGTILEPCPGVDSLERLPLIYILNNEGNIQIEALYHTSAIKANKFEIPTLTYETSKSQENVPSFTSLNLNDNKSDEEKKTIFGATVTTTTDTASQPFGSSISSNNTQTTIGKPTFSFGSETKPISTPPAFGTPSFTSASKSENKPASLFGNTTIENPFTSADKTQSPFGQTNKDTETKQPFAFGTNTATTPSFGTSAFAASTEQNKQPFSTVQTTNSTSTAAPAFGTPSFGQPTFGAPSFGTPSFGKPAFGTPVFGAAATNANPQAAPAFGKPAFGTSTFGSIASPDNKEASSLFGKSSFGAPSTSTSSPFGQFASNANGSTESSSFSKFATDPKTQGTSSPFGKLDSKVETTTKSPFGQLSSGNNIFSKPLFGVTDNKESPFAKFGTKIETSSEEKENDVESSDLSDTTVEQTPFKLKEDTTGKEIEKVETEVKTEEPKADRSSVEESKRDIKEEAPRNEEVSEVEAKEDIPEGEEQEKVAEEGKEASESQEISISELSEGEASEEGTTLEPSKEEEIRDEVSIAEEENKEEESTPAKSPKEEKEEKLITQDTDKETISSLTNRIKQSATKGSLDFSTPTFKFGSAPTPETMGESPFSTFAGKLDQKTGSSFSFDDLPSKKLNDENDEPYSEDVSDEEEDNVSRASEIEEAPNSPNESDANQQKKKETGLESMHAEQKESSELEVETIETSESNIQSVTEKESKEASSVENVSESSKEQEETESYDDLRDITTDELDRARSEPPDFQQPKSKLVSHAVDATIQTIPDLSESSTQTIPPVVIDEGTQGEPPVVLSAVCQTDPIPPIDFQVQVFENDENYLAELLKPKPLKKYFTNASVSSIPHMSNNPVIISMESTYHLVTAELSVLFDNIENLNKFFIDQSTPQLNKRTKKSIANIYTWRIFEANTLYDILKEETGNINDNIMNVDQLNSTILSFLEKKFKELLNKSVEIKEEYTQLQCLFDNDSADKLKRLRLHQGQLQSKLRKKMSKTHESLTEIDGALNALKMYTIKNKRLDENPLVTKLAHESTSSIKLLKEIRDLRDEIEALQKSLNLSNSEELSLEKRDIQSAEIIEAGLVMNTKKQVGQFFKNTRV